VGLKYGLTSSITAEATYNPDFSQVESDAFQVEVNRRYPVFTVDGNLPIEIIMCWGEMSSSVFSGITKINV